MNAQYLKEIEVLVKTLTMALEHASKLSAFVVDCRDNWDCDTDAHKHNTTCRKCEANKLIPKV